MSRKVPYWRHGYGKLICSECGYVIDEDDSMERYIHYRKERGCCPSCNADMREPYKRCYYAEHNPGGWNACGEAIVINDIAFCYRQTRERTEELRSWGCYYKCEYMSVPNEQLTLW